MSEGAPWHTKLGIGLCSLFRLVGSYLGAYCIALRDYVMFNIGYRGLEPCYRWEWSGEEFGDPRKNPYPRLFFKPAHPIDRKLRPDR
jgi:hypothetical protein